MSLSLRSCHLVHTAAVEKIITTFTDTEVLLLVGKRWRLSWKVEVVLNPDGVLVIREGDGMVLILVP